MTTVVELEKLEIPALSRKKFCTAEIYKMMEVGILREESGWELIGGEIIHRMSIGSRHAGTIRRLEKFLERNFGDQLLISGRNPIHLDEYNETGPDIALLRLRGDFYTDSHPSPPDILLVIEVSDSTIEYDREIKKTLYAESGIAEFWIINLKQNTIETYSNPANGTYYQMQIFGRGDTVLSKNISYLSLEANEILGKIEVTNETES